MHENGGGHPHGGGTPRKAALIIAGAASKGPFAAGALVELARDLERCKEERCFDVSVVVGTSSGALNAAVFAAGLRAGRALEAALALQKLWREKASWNNILCQKSRVAIVADAMKPFCEQREPVRDVHLRLVTTLLGGGASGRSPHCADVKDYTTYEVEYEYGPDALGDPDIIQEIAAVAIASAAIPGVFPPVKLETKQKPQFRGRRFADGGLVDNAPIGWALRKDPEIDHLIVVTPDPAVLKEPRCVTPLPLKLVLRALLQERLTRDIRTAQAFNCDIVKMSQSFGISLSAIRAKLGWRLLEIIEVRPPVDPPGGFLFGFLFQKLREANLRMGEEAAKAALGPYLAQVGSGAQKAPPVAAPPQLPAAPFAPTELALSKHLQKSSELLLIADLKQGQVPAPALVPGSLSYGARLATLLTTFFKLRQAGIERSPVVDEFVGPLEGVGSLHFVQWAILPGDGAGAGGERLLLAVTFDGPWESYIQGVVDRAGTFLDIILCHCVGYEGNSTADGYERFSQWVRSKQVPSEFFHAGAPDLSTIDLRYLRGVEQRVAGTTGNGLSRQLAELSVPMPPVPAEPPLPPAARDHIVQAAFEQALAAFFSLVSHYYATDDPRQHNELTFFKSAVITELDLITMKPTPVRRRAHFAWYESLAPFRKGTRQVPPPDTVDLDQVQGNILNPYKGMLSGRLVFLQFHDLSGAADFLSTRPTTELAGPDKDGHAWNVALTATGLRALRLDGATLGQFPEEFMEGMQERAPSLGDVGASHPSNWLPPIAAMGQVAGSPQKRRIELSGIDAIAILQSRKDDDDQWFKATIQAFEPRVRVLATQRLHRKSSDGGVFNELFGFADGLSQPVPWASGFTAKAKRDVVATGEILLGYADARGLDPYRAPDRNGALFQNGSFLAMRKFVQDVQGFEAFVEQAAGTSARTLGDPNDPSRKPAEVLRAKIMGRYRDGSPAGNGTAGAGNNSFDYSKDTTGSGCPFSSHVRRANPRFDGTPRIMRRGFTYDATCSDDASEPQGLVFMAYCASLGNQYEVIQQWVNGGSSTGTLGAQVDPLFAIPGRTLPGYTFAHPGGNAPGGVVQVPLPLDRQFVRVLWGLYLFVPSVAALGAIAAGAREAARSAEGVRPGRCPFVAQGMARPPEGPGGVLGYLEPPPTREPRDRLKDWQRILEDFNPYSKRQAFELWTQLRGRSEELHASPYGLLVSRATAIARVFAESSAGGKYSVAKYGERMGASLGKLYLGIDGGLRGEHDDYWRLSGKPNAFLSRITRKAAFEVTYRVASQSLEVARKQAIDARSTSADVDLQEWFSRVLYAVIARWFGVPTDGSVIESNEPGPLPGPGVVGPVFCPGDFAVLAKYIFDPAPNAELSGYAQARGQVVGRAARQYASERLAAPRRSGGPSPEETLIDFLVREGYEADTDELGRAWSGAILGLVGPTGGMFFTVMYDWLVYRKLWRLQDNLVALRSRGLDIDLDQTATTAGAFFVRAVLESMEISPMPFLLHRTTKVDGVDEKVVLGMASAGAELAALGGAGDPRVLFGFGPDGAKAQHSCPGMEMAIGVLLGAALAVLEQPNVRYELPPVGISFGV